MFDTPILFIIFNRLDTTQQVFAQIKKVQPTQLFIAADGPRMHIVGEKERCETVRNWVLSNLDWVCEVKTLFRDKNLGCGKAVSEAITWFLENVEEGIIIEDDCLPSSSFFLFCSELLERYRDNEKVALISGNNFQMGNKRGNASYYFSRYTHIWGWATWRRAWMDYDFAMTNYEWLKDNYLHKKLLPLGMMNAAKYEGLDTWDVQWMYTNFIKNTLSIMPKINLVENIGFSADATHTQSTIPDYIKYSHKGELSFPLRHPLSIKASHKADLFSAKNVFNLDIDLSMHKLFRKIKNTAYKICHYKIPFHDM